MRNKTKYLLAAAVFLPYLGAYPAFADGKGKGHTKSGTLNPAVTVVGFKADLAPVVVGGNGEGEAEYKNRSSSLGTSETFKAEAEFAIPDASLGITDLNTAATAQLELHLSRGTADYAVCSMAIKEIEFDYKPAGVEIEAEFGVSVSQETLTGGTPTLKQKLGSCTLLPGGVSGVPTVAAGDTATVVSVVSSGVPPTPVSTAILTGTFE